MQYRRLGKTGLMVSEVGFGGEWLERHDVEHSVDLIRYAHEKGINIIDCWMADPKSRDIIGRAIAPCRDEWVVQGHIGATWQNEQYVRTRDMKYVKPAFEDLLRRIGGGYIDLGIAQNGYGQGFIGMQVLLHLAEGWSPVDFGEHIVTGYVFITKDNVDTFSEDVADLSVQIASELETTYLTKG